MNKFLLYINGELVSSQSGGVFDSLNPSTGEVYCQIADANQEDMSSAIKAARKAFDSGIWSELSLEARGRYLKRIADLIRENAKELADIECKDIGKTTKQTTFIDVPTAADTFEYFSKIEEALSDKENKIDHPVKSVIVRDPIGVVGCTIPWNYPLIMAAWKIAPALIAGNTVVLKPSSQGCASVMKLAEMAKKAELPEGVLNIVATKDHDVAGMLASSPDVDKFSFTGGTKTGQDVMRQAASNTKRLTLELGGKSPNIVLEDCDIEAAIGGTMSAIFMNQGQMCTAGSRLILSDKIYDEFLEKLVVKTKALKIGDAIDYSTDFGPLISKRHVDSVLAFIEKGVKEGAKLICGGKVPEGDEYKGGAYLEPAIFADVDNSMTIAQEEIFGPVLSVIKFSSEEEAIKIANDSKYGLAACVWTKDEKKANSVARKLHCGTVWVNTYGGFYNEAPFGGYKQSGFGRELGLEGLLEYTQCKHICTDKTPGGKPLVSSWF
ncbi:MAG: aldehyde dehydrogenase family protein [Candidatus Omnitrophica bacterium]|nr:aldehyde dehydrogenase family protein [Candidatus Omnitrophota bacterium]